MIKKLDLEHLEKKYQLALESVDDIKRVGGYPCYPQEIKNFMQELTKKPWFISYTPTEISNTLKNIEQADIDEIRAVLVEINRAERFCDGSWENSLRNRVLDPVFQRLRDVITV